MSFLFGRSKPATAPTQPLPPPGKPNPSGPSAGSTQDLNVLFNSFLPSSDKPPSDEDSLGPEQLALFAEALGIEPDDVVMYILAWKMKCKTPMRIFRPEWVTGLSSMKVFSIGQLKQSLGIVRNETSIPSAFKDFYLFAFSWIRDNSAAKVISIDTACTMWPIIWQATKTPFPLLSHWIRFLSGGLCSKKNIALDLWSQLLIFSTVSIEKYSSDDAWPLAIDEFVSWYKSSAQQK